MFSIILGKCVPETRHRLVIIIWLLFMILSIWFIIKQKRTDEITKIIKFTSVVLLVFQVLLIARFEINRLILNSGNTSQIIDLPKDLPIEELPDIYFIILDAHSSSSVVKEKFGYDNAAVIAELQEMGFYQADCSQANYTKTDYVISSTLNVNYLDEYLENPRQVPDHENSYTLQFLDNYGYQKMKFETRATHNLSFGEDIYLARERETWNMFNVFPFTRMNAYEAELIQTTWLQPMLTLILNYNEYLPLTGC